MSDSVNKNEASVSNSDDEVINIVIAAIPCHNSAEHVEVETGVPIYCDDCEIVGNRPMLSIPLISSSSVYQTTIIGSINRDRSSCEALESTFPWKKWICYSALYLVSGILLGSFSAVVGWTSLIHFTDPSTTNISITSIALCSLSWSIVTSLVALGVYTILTTIVTATDPVRPPPVTSISSNWEQHSNFKKRCLLWLEYCLSVGVFVGFCVACAMADMKTNDGVPMAIALLTTAVALTWIIFMVACCFMATLTERPTDIVETEYLIDDEFVIFSDERDNQTDGNYILYAAIA
jgi:hypothetical protein